MTLRTALVISGDSESAQKAVADLDRAIASAEGEAKAYAQAYKDADASIGRLASSQAAAKREIDQAKTALAAGEISVEEYNRSLLETKTALGLVQAEHREQIATLKQTKAAYELAQAPQRTNVELTNAQRAGSQQLAMQLGDMATMYALNARPMQIFASQGMQVVQAIGLMQGGAKGLIGFLGGPWGLGLMAATTALVPLVSSLWEAEDAMEAVEMASDGMADAQGDLAKMFDLATGAIKDQNAQLRLNLSLKAMNLRSEAEEARNEARSSAVDSGQMSWGAALRRPGALYSGLAFSSRDTAARSRLDAILAESDPDKAAKLGLSAVQWAQKADFSRVDISREEFMNAVTSAVSAASKENTAAGIERSLADNELDPMFREDKKTDRGNRSRRSGQSAADKLAKIEDRYLTELARQQQEELQARLALTTNIDDELNIRLDLLAAERDERERQIRNSKDYTEEQKKAQLAHLDLLYGKRAQQVDGQIIVTDQGLLGAAEKERITQREISMGIDMLAMQAAALDAQAGVALGLDERFTLEDRALKIQQDIERKLLEQDIAQGRILDAAQARASLEDRQAAQREGQRLDRRGPLERYSDDLTMGAEEMRRFGENLVVQELEHLRAGMRDGITDALGVDDPFLNAIIDMFIQQVLIAPFAEALQSAGAGDLVGGLFSSVLGLFGGGRETGGPVSPGKIYAVNERSTAPGLFMPLAPGRIDPAGANDNGGMVGRGPVMHQYFDLRGAVVMEKLYEQMNQIARGEAQAAVAGYDQIAADRVQEQIRRRN